MLYAFDLEPLVHYVILKPAVVKFITNIKVKSCLHVLISV